MKLMMMMISLVMTAAMAHATTDNTGDDVNVLIKRTFEKEFPNAQYAYWQKVSDEGIYVVRFVYHEQPFVSYLDEDGNLLATVRTWDKKHLPVQTSDAIKRKYSGFEIAKVEEMTTPGDLSYLILLEKSDSKVFLRAYPNGLIYVIRKEKIKKAAF